MADIQSMNDNISGINSVVSFLWYATVLHSIQVQDYTSPICTKTLGKFGSDGRIFSRLESRSNISGVVVQLPLARSRAARRPRFARGRQSPVSHAARAAAAVPTPAAVDRSRRAGVFGPADGRGRSRTALRTSGRHRPDLVPAPRERRRGGDGHRNRRAAVDLQRGGVRPIVEGGGDDPARRSPVPHRRQEGHRRPAHSPGRPPPAQNSTAADRCAGAQPRPIVRHRRSAADQWRRRVTRTGSRIENRKRVAGVRFPRTGC